MLHLLFVLKLISLASCLESPEPEVLLQPRNFNPHPYSEGRRVPPAVQALRRIASAASPGNQARTGPVLFPSNPDDNLRLDAGHSYVGVARKQKTKLAGRFLVDHQENNINPRVYSGLANYAAKVLKKPASPAHNGFPDPSLAAHKKNYAFSYSVRDHATGDDFSHSQSQNAAATNGEYRVKLPDGRVQIVSYTADKNGYKANVKYADDDLVEPQQQFQPQQQLSQLEHQMQREEPEYGYYEPRHRDQVTQIEVPVYDDAPYHKYEPEYVPTYREKIPSQYLIGDKVRIYPGSVSGGHVPQKVVRIGGNIQSAQKLNQIHVPVRLSDKYTHVGGVLPDLHYARVPQNILGPVAVSVSTVSPPLYGQVYITTPKYALSHTSAHPVSVTPTPGYYKRR